MSRIDGGERDPHQAALMARASELGIATRDLSDMTRDDSVRYQRGAESIIVKKGRHFPSLRPETRALCDDKELTKALLHEVGVPVPQGASFSTSEERSGSLEAAMQTVRELMAEHRQWVLKPRAGTHGEGVLLRPETAAQVLAHLDAQESRAWVMERFIEGHDLRLQAIGGDLVAACVRTPAYVIGDGVSDVSALVEAEAARVNELNPNNHLGIDDESLELLAIAGYSTDDVPPDGLELTLRRVANMSQGARVQDVPITSALHPGWKSMVKRVADRLGAPIFALDARVDDPMAAPDAGAVLEINARPEWLHHTFADGGAHDIAGALLRSCFKG